MPKWKPAKMGTQKGHKGKNNTTTTNSETIPNKNRETDI
jgi:hypothetical protein